MRHLLFSAAAIMLSAAQMAQAQDIEISELGSAQAYEPGSISIGDGALGSSLWTGTSADIAEALIMRLPENYKFPAAKDLARSALLSPGAPPENDADSSFAAARMKAVIRLAEMGAARDIAYRTSGLSISQTLNTDMALLSGDISGACDQSDSVQEARSESYWMKLRAFCHAERGETAAAEVTLDLLKNSGHSDKGFEQLMRPLIGVPGSPDLKELDTTPLSIVMMNKSGLAWPGETPAVAAAQMAYSSIASPDDKLKALLSAGNALSDEQMRDIILGLNIEGKQVDENLVGGLIGQPAAPNLDTALGDTSAKGFSQLYQLIQNGGPDRQSALIAILRRADAAGAFTRFVSFLETPLLSLSYSDLRPSDMPLIARTAVLRSDLGALQQLHSQLADKPGTQDRIALAADALGNGFFGGSLGTDIDTRLEKPGQKARALRDALIAHALGAKLSDSALAALDEKPMIGRMSGDMVALEAAVRNRSQAEAALRAAIILEDAGDGTLSDGALFTVIDALYRAGLTDHAAQIAAQDFLSRFTD